MKIVCETERLVIRQFNLDDAEFIIRLLNEESFIRYIADKKVRTNADAVNYLTDGPLLSYTENGYGLNLVLLKEAKVPIGMCGLIKRNEFKHPDLGFAFLPEFCGKGYALEAAVTVLEKEMKSYSLTKVLAVTFEDNRNSIGLLEKMGFSLKGTIKLHNSQNYLYDYSV
ncbi:GNAT family N-acetyltransferase [Idiomarina sp. HP20-50]|uniref:GNAT family N-acetyltransferase n=1 Tax=Idiomarina sp. HP20-50 TaxID=3070813 RepID=UPI00294ACC73|nr:GNAT family N-acetyltransferase [Idiomarina sp. HP20-50]MDV6315324.1 GNAT family N-acetyltransferase [Idiomarina sp. HP20-50]